MPGANHRKEILFDGFSEEEILGLPVEQMEGLVLTGQPMVFRAGSATVLGEFRREKDRLVVELAQIEGGGEGVLVSLGSLVNLNPAVRQHGERQEEGLWHLSLEPVAEDEAQELAPALLQVQPLRSLRKSL